MDFRVDAWSGLERPNQTATKDYINGRQDMRRRILLELRAFKKKHMPPSSRFEEETIAAINDCILIVKDIEP